MMTRRAAFITGGGSGIGQACARSLVREGMAVTIADIDADSARAAAEQLTGLGAFAFGVGCDVTSEEGVRSAIAEAIRRFGRIDVLVTAAGIDLHRGIAETTLAHWQRVIDINLTGSFLCIKHVQEAMARNSYGRIICVGSTSGVIGMGYPAYSASKAALTGLVRSVARELSPMGITANVIAPGPTRTPLTERLWKDDPERLGRLTSKVPVGRVADASEIAEAIAFLASEQAGFVNGSEFLMDGGLTSVWRAGKTE